MNSLLLALPVTLSSSSPPSRKSLRKSCSVRVRSARSPVSRVTASLNTHLNLIYASRRFSR